MNCKYCGQPLDEDMNTCPACGGDQTATEAEKENLEPMTEELEASQVVSEDTTDEGQELPDQEIPAPKPGKTKGAVIAAVIAGIVAVVAVVALILTFTGKDKKDDPASGQLTESGVLDALDVNMVDENGVFIPHDFMKSADQITQEMADEIVATSGEQGLTNAVLSYYYWQQYYNLYSQYGMYISYMLDPAVPLSEQMVDETHTWQDMLLQSAMGAFRQNAAIYEAAVKAGYELDDSSESYLASLQGNLDADAVNGGYADADAYLQDYYGPYASAESYLAYARTSFTASGYLSELFDDIEYSDDDVSKYYDDNAETYASKGLAKDDVGMVDVRHILIQPVADEGAELDESGRPALTEANWADAEARANEIYESWKSGEATEDSFAALASEKSEDGGSVSNGGLYEDVYPGQMVPEFNDWCFDAARESGDTAVVKTSYGFHIMYFSEEGDTPYWYQTAESDYFASRQQALVEELVAASNFQVDYKKVVLMESQIAKQSQEQAAAQAQTEAPAEVPEN